MWQSKQTSRGLSPPTRGNPVTPDMFGVGTRSIPAHAGEPYSYPRFAESAQVYPRPRGGTPGVRRL